MHRDFMAPTTTTTTLSCLAPLCKGPWPFSRVGGQTHVAVKHWAVNQHELDNVPLCITFTVSLLSHHTNLGAVEDEEQHIICPGF